MRFAIVAVAAAIAACLHPATPPAPPAPPFTDAIAAAIAARDARAAAARFAPDAEVSVIAGPALHGRDAIARGFDALFARFANARVTMGRQWIGRDASVLELVFTAARDGKPIGVVAAAVVTFDRAGEVVTARLYVDVPTIVGQIDPSRLPEGARTRAPVTSPPAGTAVRTTTGTTTEAANLAAAAASWARLDAHDPAGSSPPRRPTTSTRTSPVPHRSTSPARTRFSSAGSASSPTSRSPPSRPTSRPATT